MQWLSTLWTKVFIMYEDSNAAVCAALLRETSNHTLKGRCAMKPADWGMLIDHRGMYVYDCLFPDLLRFYLFIFPSLFNTLASAYISVSLIQLQEQVDKLFSHLYL